MHNPDKVDRIAISKGLRCPYCHWKMKTGPRKPTRDHVHPKSLGGKQIVICCRRCNEHKANYSLQSWAALLRQHNDPRAKIVSHLADELDAGLVKIVPGDVSTLGLAPGIFA